VTGLPAEPVVGFVRALRGAGVDVPISCSVTFAEALGALDITRREQVYWAGRATLVRRPEDIETYDSVFAGYWESARAAGPEATTAQSLTLMVDDPDADESTDDGDASEQDPADSLELRFSSVEVLRHKDFAEWSDDELSESRRLMGHLRLVGEPRRSLRQRPSGARGDRPDLRRTIRLAIAAHGEPIHRRWTSAAIRPRRLVLILDVSGSMEPYARALIRFAHAAVAGRQRVEVFALGTRLTRITRELGRRDVDEAVSRAAERVVDWSGGTRIGEGLRAFNDLWGQRGTARGATVVILSDGWDRGDPDILDRQMSRLSRLAHRIVWVNPLKVTPGYAPLARGMAAALPYIDRFVEGHNLLALEELSAIITGTDTGRTRQTVRGMMSSPGRNVS
jgi:uncharacterized protein with von Willebrand factor type A (vWA) domain